MHEFFAGLPLAFTGAPILSPRLIDRRSAAFQDTLDLALQRGDLGVNHIPNQIVVHPEIAVNQSVPHAGHGAPFRPGMRASEALGQLFRGFSDDLEAADERTLERLVREETLAG